MTESRRELALAAEAIGRADALLVMAGAGMGVDSGLPDFRGTEGFWNAYPAYRQLGLSFSQLANPRWFEEDPELAWGFYGHRMNLYRETRPHAGFAILKKWGERMKRGAFVCTSNVDGHFQAAGFTAEKVWEVHGSIHYLQCVKNCREIWPAGDVHVNVDAETFRAGGELPRCACGALARPNILMFGDGDWRSGRTDAQEDLFHGWLKDVSGGRLVVVECGAGTAVATIRYLSENVVRAARGRLVRINVREAEVPHGEIGIAMGALAGLREIDDILALDV